MGSTDGSGEAMWVNITIAGEDAADVAVEAAKIIAREDLTAAEKLQLVTELVETNGGTVTTETTDSGEKKSFIKKFFGKKKRDALEGFMAEENAPWSRPNLNQWANGKGILREMEVRS